MWDEQELANFSKGIECEGSKVFRRRGSDEEVVASAKFSLQVGLPFKMDPGLLQVVCFAKDGPREVVYSNVHFLPKLPSTNPKPPPESKVPGVLILLIESLSRVNAEEQLPQTVQVLRLMYNATLLHGLTKVGDNTFPNLVALLTGVWVGRRDGKGQEGGHEEDGKKKETNIDHLPFLWNAWRDLGCPTLYSEDSPNINTFTYWRRGFTSPPTTIYHRPWWLAIAKLPRKSRSRKEKNLTITTTNTDPHGCTLGQPSYVHQLELATNFLRQTQALCSFSLVFHVALGHTTDINQVADMDTDLADWLRLVHREGLVQDKLVLVGGDHGNRFSRSRLSLGGRIEERMPFMAVSLPRKLEGGGSKAVLEENANKLVTHFDLHKTIESLLPSPAEVQPSMNRTPISLLRPIPSNRTCREAGVPPSYCICTPERYLSLRNPEARKAAEALVREASRLLQPYAHLCLPLGLSRLLEARRVGEAASRQVRVTVLTTTSATLEALVEGLEVVGDINRIDYMGARDCLTDGYVQLFCKCKTTAPHLLGG